jgi:drug/metabolite transporter (DMT)-like permease
MDKKVKGSLILVLTALMYGFFALFTRVIAFNIPLFYQSFLRNLLVGIILFAAVILFKQWKKVRRVDILWIIGRTLIGLVAFYSIYVSLVFIPVGLTYFLYYSAALITGYILGRFLFGERITPLKIGSFVLAFIGLVLIYSFSLSNSISLYALLALLSGACGSVWNIFAKKLGNHYSATQLNLLDVTISFAASLVLSIIWHEQWVPITFSQEWIAIFILAFYFLATGQFIVWGFKYVDAQLGTLILQLDIIFAVLLGYFIFHEVLNIATIIGGILICIAIFLPYLKLTRGVGR